MLPTPYKYGGAYDWYQKYVPIIFRRDTIPDNADYGAPYRCDGGSSAGPLDLAEGRCYQWASLELDGYQEETIDGYFQGRSQDR